MLWLPCPVVLDVQHSIIDSSSRTTGGSQCLQATVQPVQLPLDLACVSRLQNLAVFTNIISCCCLVASLSLINMVQDACKQWQFDILGFADATPGCTLSLLGFHMLKSQGLVSEFNLDEAKLCMYLRRIESGYDDTIPYHNR